MSRPVSDGPILTGRELMALLAAARTVYEERPEGDVSWHADALAGAIAKLEAVVATGAKP